MLNGPGGAVVSVPVDWRDGAEARWLSEVEAQLRRAQSVLSCLDLRRPPDCDIGERIESALAEALSLRITRTIAEQEKIHPNWTESDLWPAQPDLKPLAADLPLPRSPRYKAPAVAASNQRSQRTRD